MLNGKKGHTSDVNNQSLEQSQKVQNVSMRFIGIHTMIGLNDHQLFLKASTYIFAQSFISILN